MRLANRKRTKPLTTAVLHATAGKSLTGAISTLIARGLSYHYIIDKNGKTVKCVSDEAVAFHAGKSVGPNGPNVNDYSIGISFVNDNSGNDPYTKEQIDACIELIEALKRKYPLLIYLTTHAIISPGRKTDPRGFPVKEVASECEMRLWDGRNF